MKLNFPPEDSRSNGRSFNPKRPWLKQGALCDSVMVKRCMRAYTATVHFDDAPKNIYDLVSPEFLKKRGP